MNSFPVKRCEREREREGERERERESVLAFVRVHRTARILEESRNDLRLSLKRGKTERANKEKSLI